VPPRLKGYHRKYRRARKRQGAGPCALELFFDKPASWAKGSYRWRSFPPRIFLGVPTYDISAAVEPPTPILCCFCGSRKLPRFALADASDITIKPRFACADCEPSVRSAIDAP
jgi:hypothetical protein